MITPEPASSFMTTLLFWYLEYLVTLSACQLLPILQFYLCLNDPAFVR